MGLGGSKNTYGRSNSDHPVVFLARTARESFWVARPVRSPKLINESFRRSVMEFSRKWPKSGSTSQNEIGSPVLVFESGSSLGIFLHITAPVLRDIPNRVDPWGKTIFIKLLALREFGTLIGRVESSPPKMLNPILEKNPRAHKNKIGAFIFTKSTMSNDPKPITPSKHGISWSWRFSPCRKNAKILRRPYNWRSHFWPQNCGQEWVLRTLAGIGSEIRQKWV